MKKKVLKKLVMSTLGVGVSFALVGCNQYTTSLVEQMNQYVHSIAEGGSDVEASEDEAAAENADRDVTTDASGEDTIVFPDPGIKENLPEVKPSANEDFHLYVNYEDLKNTELPAGYPSYSTFNILEEEAEVETKALLEEGDFSNPDYDILSKYYNMYRDMDARNEAGWNSLVPIIEKIKSIETLDEYYEVLKSDFLISDTVKLISLGVIPDDKNSNMNVVYITAAKLGLEDSAEYTNPTELGELYKEANNEYQTALLKKYGFSDKETEDMVNAMYKLEESMAENIYPTEVRYRADYSELIYNPYSYEELIELAGNEDYFGALKVYSLDNQDKYIVTEPDYIKSLGNYFTEDNLEALKAYAIICVLEDAAKVTDAEAYELYNDWINKKTGSSGMMDIDKLAYQSVSEYMGELLGDMYASYYFSEEEKKDAENIIKSVMQSLRDRIQSEDWMSDATKEIALNKLDSIVVNVGYPDELYFDYSKYEFDDSADFYTNYMNIYGEYARQYCSYAGKEVNKKAWGIRLAPNVVNACYIPSYNSICFPAAILKLPFYSKDNSLAMNYGALGCVAGHELTHAFDTTGSQFDKDGNLSNWWTDEDKVEFKKLTDKVANRYACYATVDDNHVNGDLTIGETVADLGGVAASLDALNALDSSANYDEFFEGFAKVWFRITTRENALNRLKTDPHAPNFLRTNITLSQFEEFLDTYNIVEGDQMYVAPEDRLRVW